MRLVWCGTRTGDCAVMRNFLEHNRLMSDENVVTELTDEECFNCLSTVALGRVVVHSGDDVDIYPVNYVVDRGEGSHPRSVLFRTAEGSKLVSLTVNNQVLFEVDSFDESDATSVVIRGTAHRLTSSAEINEADTLDLKPWLPTLKYNYVRIVPDSVSGRYFKLGDEPDRYMSTVY